MNDISFTIPLVPITKKNSQRIITNRKTGRTMVIPSKAYKQYEKDCAPFMDGKGLMINDPVNISAEFVMPTRRRVDLVNLEEALLDILVHYGVISDDNSNVVASMDGSRVIYEKGNGKTNVKISGVSC